jgi:hypothetical protein
VILLMFGWEGGGWWRIGYDKAGAAVPMSCYIVP